MLKMALPKGAVLLVAVVVSACQRAEDGSAFQSQPVPARPHQPKPTVPPERSPDAQALPTVADGEGQPGRASIKPELVQRSGGRGAGEGLLAEAGQPKRPTPARRPEAEPSVQPTDQPTPVSGAGRWGEGSAVPSAEASLETEAESKSLPPVPLVDDPESLQQLLPRYPVWIDREKTHVVMVGEVCQRRVPLELFACLRGSKEHESVIVVNTKAYVVHAGLLAVGAEPGGPVQFVPEFAPARGPQIEVSVIWEDQGGRRRRARGQDWVHDVSTVYAMFDGVVLNEVDEELNIGDQWDAWTSMHYPWVFAGSRFSKDERTGERYYQADLEGDLICVSNFPSAVLDVPIRSSHSNAALLFSAFTERIPPRGTPVTVILTPLVDIDDPVLSEPNVPDRGSDGAADRHRGSDPL